MSSTNLLNQATIVSIRLAFNKKFGVAYTDRFFAKQVKIFRRNNANGSNPFSRTPEYIEKEKNFFYEKFATNARVKHKEFTYAMKGTLGEMMNLKEFLWVKGLARKKYDAERGVKNASESSSSASKRSRPWEKPLQKDTMSAKNQSTSVASAPAAKRQKTRNNGVSSSIDPREEALATMAFTKKH